MNYKKIIKSQRVRFRILNALSWIPDSIMIKIQYRIKLKRKLNLKNPKRFTEKIQWYKLNYRNPIMHQCVDKYEVRKHIKNKGLEDILNELYGVYDSYEEINFEDLPNKFIIKATNGGGGENVIVCDDKRKADLEKIKNQINIWLNTKQKKSFGREWAYETNKNRIVIEKLLEGNDEGLSGINDYKFFCYDGKVKYVVFDGDRYIAHKRSFYDEKWNYIDVDSDCLKMPNIINKPENFEEMKLIAEKLSKEFPFVRVDLYSINGKITFGELTFYPWTGYVQYNPDEFDYKLGEFFNLEEYKNEKD